MVKEYITEYGEKKRIDSYFCNACSESINFNKLNQHAKEKHFNLEELKDLLFTDYSVATLIKD